MLKNPFSVQKLITMKQQRWSSCYIYTLGGDVILFTRDPPPSWRYIVLQQCNVVNFHYACKLFVLSYKPVCTRTASFQTFKFTVLFTLSIPPTWRRGMYAQCSDVMSPNEYNYTVISCSCPQFMHHSYRTVFDIYQPTYAENKILPLAWTISV